MQTPTFEQLPEAIALLSQKVDFIQSLIIENQKRKALPPKEQFLDITQAAKLLQLSVPTIYSKVSRKELPVMKRGNRLYFSEKELRDYIKAGRKKTLSELEDDADSYLLKNKKAE